MTKAQPKLALASNFVGKSAKEVRELALTGHADRAEALAYAQAKVAELASHKFRGQLWAATVTALSGKVAKSAPAKSAPAKSSPFTGMSPEQIAALTPAQIVALVKAAA
jgi:hypothetical protein